MKKIFLIGLLALVAAVNSNAQDKEFKLDKHSGKLKINISGVVVEGYDGNSIVFTTPQSQKKNDDDERAAGLKQINGSGYDDNTGLGINVKESGNGVEVNSIDKWNNRDLITIKVPNSMSLSVNTTSVYNQKSIDVKNFKGEVEVSVVYNNVTLENITGPLNAKSVYGNITSKFMQPVKGPVSIVSVYRFVDVSIPDDIKANVNLTTNYGKIYSSADLKIQREVIAKTDGDEDMKEWTHNDNIKGTLNGGGLDFILKSSYGKIYLRKN